MLTASVRTLGWQSAIYSSGQPDWICNALVQSLYSYAKNTVWVDEKRSDRRKVWVCFR